ncbi:MAG: MarR family winged helix-turn-helix transcriptional regulator [Planctomycetota bacterium]
MVETDENNTFDRRILRAMRRIIRAVDMHSRKVNDHFGVTTPQMICLNSLVRLGSVTLTDLARDVDLNPSTVNGIVDRLERKGYVRRHRGTADRRRVFLELLPAGREVVRSPRSLLQDHLAQALSELPELERMAIVLSLERVVSLMEAQPLQGPPRLTSDTHLTSEEPKEPTS